MSGQTIPMIERRRIEAEILNHVFQTVLEASGRVWAIQTVKKAVESLAFEAGRLFALQADPAPSLDHFQTVLDMWRGTGALDINDVERSEDRLTFSVVRCEYVELYKDMGLDPDLIPILSCPRDFPFARGYSEKLHLERPETIALGFSACRFTYTWKSD